MEANIYVWKAHSQDWHNFNWHLERSHHPYWTFFWCSYFGGYWFEPQWDHALLWYCRILRWLPNHSPITNQKFLAQSWVQNCLWHSLHSSWQDNDFIHGAKAIDSTKTRKRNMKSMFQGPYTKNSSKAKDNKKVVYSLLCDQEKIWKNVCKKSILHKIGFKDSISDLHKFMLFHLLECIPFDLPHTI